ncbi:MAG: D-glycero-beta-D-manno-heptose 1-phosphate adenylyltransferase, partial [Planctomycetes bacterium]|nr:D-glycero-beta-D-manno-heptose 1-phosphate adenylyltransferase [Planctomycetota bacterium]
EHNAVLISDYAKGVCTPPIVRLAIEQARRLGLPVLVDPASSVDYQNYRGATAITPNRLETKLATGREIRGDDDAFQAGRQLCQQFQLDYVFITLDSDGIALVLADGRAERFPTRRRQVYDITGAGDMVLAMIGVGAAEGVPPDRLARLANVAGGLEVEQLGVVPISREQILADLLSGSHRTHEKICDLQQLARHVEARRRLGHRIVLTNGCFDLLHAGHVTYLEQAAREGDCLIVAINSDSSVRRLGKEPGRPIFDQQTRAAMLAALEAVDYVTIFDETTPHAVIERIRPDLLVKGGTYSQDEIVGRELVEAYGGQVKPLGLVPGISTTAIVKRIRGQAMASTDANFGAGTIPLTPGDSAPPEPKPPTQQAQRKAG